MGLTTIFLILFQFYLVFTVIVLLLDNREPSETFAWILIFLLLPGFGFGLYLMFGRNWRKSSVGSKRLPQFVAKKLFDVFEPLIDRQDNEGKKIHDLLSPESEDLVALLYNNSHSVLTANNDLEIFYKGEEKFKVLKKDLLSAQKFIYMEYFIWRFGDKLGQEIKDILIQKVKEGVQVKILYDFSGCFFSAKRKYIQELRDSGIEIYPFFNYLSSFKIHTINYRNHRKIVIVDGKTAYVGGMNLGQEYIDGGKKFNSWRDTHLRLTGESVGILQAVFAIDWYNTTSDENVFDKETFTSLKKKHDFSEKTLIQIPTSGFDSRWPSILHSYFSLVNMAQKNLYISSPYLVPDPSILQSLKIAAMRNVDVRILIPQKADQGFTQWAAFSYFEELLGAGVRIFLYKEGFFHAKVISCDDKMCSIGTANLDIRSLKLNYEVNAIIYDEKITQNVAEQFHKDLEISREITLTEVRELAIHIKLRNSLARLISPVL